MTLRSSNGWNLTDRTFSYIPDLYAYDLHWTVPMAERCYGLIAADKPFPPYLTVEPALFGHAFTGRDREERLLIYGAFLWHLEEWQEKFMFERFHHWSFMHSWEGHLREVVEKYRAQLPKKP
jgi:hypothetical protein